MSKTEFKCPISPVVKIISGKWTTLILWEIYKGNNHYGTIKKSLSGINTRTLSNRLKMLNQNNIVNRKVKPTNPPTVKYILTKKGLELVPIFSAMKKWSDKYK